MMMFITKAHDDDVLLKLIEILITGTNTSGVGSWEPISGRNMGLLALLDERTVRAHSRRGARLPVQWFLYDYTFSNLSWIGPGSRSC